MQIITDYRSPNQSPRTQPIRCLVVHATAGGLVSSLTWLCDPASRVSAHYVIAKTGAIYQLLPDAAVAWHAGRSAWRGQADVNAFSLGVELENANTGRDPYPPAQLDRLIDLVRVKLRVHAIPIENLVRHRDIAVPRGRKTDPAGLDWAGVRARVVAAPEPSAPYVATSAAWVRSSPVGGAHVRDLTRGDVVQVVAIVAGDLLVRPAGVSNQWAELARGAGWVWLPQLREQPQ